MSLDGHIKISQQLQVIAAALEELLNDTAGEKVLFALHIFGEGADGRGQYVSNCEREDVKKALAELLDRWKQDGRDDGPYHIYRKQH